MRSKASDNNVISTNAAPMPPQPPAKRLASTAFIARPDDERGAGEPFRRRLGGHRRRVRADHVVVRSLAPHRDRKSTRLNSSHRTISYAVFCLKKKKKKKNKMNSQKKKKKWMT